MCCAAFPISTTLDTLHDPSRHFEDNATLLDMLLPIPREMADARLVAVGSPQRTVDGERYYTCRHWDERSRRCGIYSGRPGMCRSYPGGTRRGRGQSGSRRCEHGCDCEGAPLLWDGD